MILPDANVLIYAFRKDTERHSDCRSWLEETLSKQMLVGISDLVLSTVVRIVTHPKIFARPSTLDEVFEFTKFIKSCPNVIPVLPGKRHWMIFERLCRTANAKGNMVTDAYLAALAIETGAEWITSDRDFARFPGLKWHSPLSG